MTGIDGEKSEVPATSRALLRDAHRTVRNGLKWFPVGTARLVTDRRVSRALKYLSHHRSQTPNLWGSERARES